MLQNVGIQAITTSKFWRHQKGCYKGSCTCLRFAAGSKSCSAVSGWKEFLFTVNGWEDACVCGFEQ